MAAKQKILIVDDDVNIAELISLYLTKECFDTKMVHDGESALKEFETYAPNLILLDLMLPGIDGYQVCREIRAKANVPIIMLSAKGEIFDKVLGLELGADDYVTKPYNLQILLARISRVLRRVYEAADSSIMRLGEVIMDVSKSSITCRGKSVDLTKNELRIMHCLFQNRNTIVSREKLMQHMWDCDVFVDDNTLTVNINRLRKKLEYVGLSDFIETRRGQGYIVYENQ